MTVSALLAAPAFGQEPPNYVETGGKKWVSFDRAFDRDGQPAADLFTKEEAEWLKKKLHGYDLAMSRKPEDAGVDWKACEPILNGGYGVLTQKLGRFDLALILSEVLVVAEVAEITPGIGDLNAAALLSLTDVVPLRSNVPLPEYLMMPLVVSEGNGRGICGVPDSNKDNLYWPEIGDRLVLLGEWDKSAVMPLDLSNDAYVAVIEDGGRLNWKFGSGPESLDELEESIVAADQANLFDLTNGLRRQEGMERRLGSIESWHEMETRGCSLTGAEVQSDGGWVPNHTCDNQPETIAVEPPNPNPGPIPKSPGC